jgi:hypothetical protein
LRVVLDHSEQHCVVHDQVELSSTHRSELPEHDVLRHTSAIIELTKTSSFEKNLNSLFERTAHQCSSVVSVDTVTGDGHQKTALGHDVNEQGLVTMIDIGSVE